MNKLNLENKLSTKYFKARILSDMVGNALGLIVLLVFLWVSYYFDWPSLVGWALIGLLFLTALGIIWSCVEPYYLYRSWRYAIDSDFIQLSYGIFIEKWITIPTTKIQAVTTTQGPVMKRFQLRAIKIRTIGMSYTIPALDSQVALKLRDDIAEFAQLKGDES